MDLSERSRKMCWIREWITSQCFGLDQEFVQCNDLEDKVFGGITSNISDDELIELAADTAAAMTTKHPDYSMLAGRILMKRLHCRTNDKFSDTMHRLYEFVDPKTGTPSPKIAEHFHDVVMKHATKIDKAINHEADYSMNYFSLKTLLASYLLGINGEVVERPQYLFMRVSLAIHLDNLDLAVQSYRMMSEGYFIHSTPTLLNAGKIKQQLCSCYMMSVSDDSLDGIYDVVKQCALISQGAGGIGVSLSKVRANGSYIRGTGGTCAGLLPVLRVLNNTARFVDQGGGVRPGAFAVYLEPWHADVYQLLECKRNTGKEEQRARDLSYALWVPDLFMRRVEADEDWTLMCPRQCPGLDEVWGQEFDALYQRYEDENRGVRKVGARQLWYRITEAQTETGMPYLLYKDACNRSSNHQHLGTIKGGNLCAEIVQFHSEQEVAVCCLASVAVNKFVNVKKGTFDFQALAKTIEVVVENLDKVIDINYYPFPQAELSNQRHRPIAVGIQGLADTFQMLKYSFDSPEAMSLNRDIYETLYYTACRKSCELAKISGPHPSYAGSPVSQGKLQFDFWEDAKYSGRYDWKLLKQDIYRHGVRNSLLTAQMPTASTASILGNSEASEPCTNNIYIRRVTAGEFQVVNGNLIRELIDLGLWSDATRNRIIGDSGSIQNLADVPDDVKLRYRTVWELSQRTLINMAADRAPFICQGQSLNLYLPKPIYGKITSMHFYAWKKGLKTGIYYLRTKAAAHPIKFTVDSTKETENGDDREIVARGRRGSIFR